MKGSSSDRGLLLAAIAMTVGTLAVAGLAGARALRPTATARHPTAISTPLPDPLPASRGEGESHSTPTPTATATSSPPSDGFADERPPPGPPPPTPPEPAPVVRRAPRERIQVPRAVSAWGT